jgi:hypothetical protein
MGQQVNKSYCLGVEEDQGVGWYERDGAANVQPEACLSNVMIFDADGQAHSVVLDQDGYLYDISGRESASGGTVGQPWKDKVGTDDSGGTKIVPELTFPADEGTMEAYYLKHLDTTIGIQPYDQSKRSTSGYDSAGFPTDFAVNLELYADGNPNSYVAYSKDIRINGTIGFAQEVDDAHSFYLKLTANDSQHILTRRSQYYEAQDEPKGPADTMTTELTDQANINDYNFAPYPVGSALTDLYSGNALTGVWTAATDPTGGTNAQTMAGGTLAGTTPTYSGDCSILFFLFAGATFPFTVAQWAVVTIDVILSGSVYYVRYMDGVGTYSHALGWDGTGWVAVCLVRSGTNLSVYEGVNV